MDCRLFGEAGDGVVERLRGVLDIVSVDAAHADASGLQEVDVVLVDEAADLRLRQAGVREHADLVDDMLPGTGGFKPEMIHNKAMFIFVLKAFQLSIKKIWYHIGKSVFVLNWVSENTY